MKLLNKDISLRVVTKVNKQIVKTDGGIMSFGSENDYPEAFEKLINGSKTAKSTAKIYANFLVGYGFEDESMNNIVIGRDERYKKITLKDMLSKVAKSCSKNQGAYIHAERNLSGESANASMIPFKQCRFSAPDGIGYSNKIYVCEDWKDPKKNIPVPYYVWNNDARQIAKQVEKDGGIENYRGQIYHIFLDNEYFYPLSTFDSVELDMDTEAQISIYNNNETRNGFAKKTLLWFPEPADEEQLEAIEKKVKDMQGADGAKVTVFTTETDLETGELKKNQTFLKETIDSSIDVKMYEELKKSTANDIRKACNALPAILIDYEDNKLGSTSGEAIKQAFDFFNLMTEDDRAILSRSFEEIFKTFPALKDKTNWAIKPLSNEKDIIESVSDADAKKLEAQAMLKGSVGGVTALIALQQGVSAGTTDLNAAIEIVKEIYGIPDDVARKMIGTPKPETNGTTIITQ